MDNLLEQSNISVPHNRKGSQLAIAIFCDVLLGTHPVEALLKANIDGIPRRKKELKNLITFSISKEAAEKPASS